MQNMDNIHIIKNNKTKELFNPEKIHEHLKYACDGLNVDQISIIKDARLRIYDGAKSSDIQDSLIKSAQEKISEETPDYELVAGRLLNQKLRKEVYDQFHPKPFKECVRERVKKGFYTSDFDTYSDEELEYFGSLINYELDNELAYSALNQMYSKYLIKYNKKCIETPQEVFMLIPMAIFYREPSEYRKKYIKIGYELLSQKKISLPTPIMNGARTTYKKYISCNLINFGDSVDSFSDGMKAILKCTSAKSGLGINASFIRGIGATVGKPSRMEHTGILPIIKAIEASTGSLSQISRGGCHFKDTEVEVLESIKINSKEYKIDGLTESKIKELLALQKNEPRAEFNYAKTKIQDVKENNYVKSFNIESDEIEPKKILKTFKPEVSDPCKILFEDGGYVINSFKHPFLILRDNKWQYLIPGEMRVGDIVLRNDKKRSKVKEIQTLNNFETEKNKLKNIKVLDSITINGKQVDKKDFKKILNFYKNLKLLKNDFEFCKTLAKKTREVPFLRQKQLILDENKVKEILADFDLKDFKFNYIKIDSMNFFKYINVKTDDRIPDNLKVLESIEYKNKKYSYDEIKSFENITENDLRRFIREIQ